MKSRQTEEYGAHRRDPDYQRRASKWVLLVDDEESIRLSVGRLLYERGYQVTACASGETALKVLSEGSRLPDAVVCDVRMPGGMDGLELLRKVRSTNEHVEIPVVLLTAKGLPQDRIAGYSAGTDAYLSKPFDPEELVSILDNVIQRHADLNTNNIKLEDLIKDLKDIRRMLAEGGAGVGTTRDGQWVKATGVYLRPDERTCLNLLCNGFSADEIAERMFLSKVRVRQLLAIMFRKVEVRNRMELVRWAIATGTVRFED
jgi:DNA-binding NarL/FixJ family response regulator